MNIQVAKVVRKGNNIYDGPTATFVEHHITQDKAIKREKELNDTTESNVPLSEKSVNQGQK